jgi:hypothetical protein
MNIITQETQKILRDKFPFLTIITYLEHQNIGIIQNFDNQFVSMYVLQENHSNHAKLDFLKCGDLWWWESNRSIPINLFLKQEFSQFKPWLKTFARKEVTVVEGPTVSMLDLINRKIKRRTIQLIKST